MRSILRHGTVATIAALAVLVTVSVGSLALAEPHPEIQEYRHELADSWTLEAAGIAPYTELTPGQADALEAAAGALVEPPLGLVRNADHGYDQCQAKLDAIRALDGAAPLLVGHELLLSNDTHAARIYVDEHGLVTFIEAGPNVSRDVPTRALTGGSEFDAAEIAQSAMCLHSTLEPGSPYCSMHPSITAYGVGFADAEGTHLIVRVSADGSVSCPEW